MITSKPLIVAPSARFRSLIPAALAALALASSLSADRIHLVSGEPIEDCTIVTETLIEVKYKSGGKGKAKSVPSADVLSIEYVRMPDDVEAADAALKDEDLELAFELYEAYLTEHLEGRAERRQLWAPAYAAHQLIALNEIVSDWKGAVKASSKLIKEFPDSRYLPGAYKAKASAQAELGKLGDALDTLNDLEELIISKDLSERWSLDCRLSKILVDHDLIGAERRKLLGTVETDAGGEFPTVRNRATVAIGESFLKEASTQGNGGSKKALDAAREKFKEVISDPSADAETLAGAHTGLGDCLYQKAASSKDADDIREALMTFLRVVVLYRDEVRYAPKAMFYAGRCFNLLGGEEDNASANKLYNRVIRNHAESIWAEQARDFRQ